jgi:hypothetical protein
MKYCCEKLKKKINKNAITEAFYPSGVELYEDDKRIYICPFCGKDLR